MCVDAIDPYGQLLAPISSTSAVSEYKYGGKEWSDVTLSYDFGARNYLPSIPRWTTMDPLAEKYYSISPYVYCAGNPVNLVDPDGKRHRLKRHFNKITVIASYYTTDEKSYQSALQGVLFWNERKGDFYIDKETGKKYEIKYELSVRLKKKILEKDNNGQEPVNFFQINDVKIQEQRPGTVGVTLNKKRNLTYIKSDHAFTNLRGEISTTAAHEIGHTLGMHHTSEGIMSETQNESRSEVVTQENIDNMIEGSESTSVSFFSKIYEAIKRRF